MTSELNKFILCGPSNGDCFCYDQNTLHVLSLLDQTLLLIHFGPESYHCFYCAIYLQFCRMKYFILINCYYWNKSFQKHLSGGTIPFLVLLEKNCLLYILSSVIFSALYSYHAFHMNTGTLMRFQHLVDLRVLPCVKPIRM
jgi:hypothetical protein